MWALPRAVTQPHAHQGSSPPWPCVIQAYMPPKPPGSLCNCLKYFPYFTTYKGSGLSEYNAVRKYVQAGVTYLFVQLCKMLALATFFPTWEGDICDFTGEFMKASVVVADLIGLNLVIPACRQGGIQDPGCCPGLGHRQADYVPLHPPLGWSLEH
ncbi:hypothetical protein CB1_000714006 [Camelus ferus]|nr:hypothetical protein CB1_000714006 [Camelus ferus]